MPSSISEMPRRARKREAIQAHIRRWILEGRYRPGDRLPTYVELQRIFDVTPVTVRRAVSDLKKDGTVITRGKLGTIVAEEPPHIDRFGLVFLGSPGDAEHWSVFWEAQLRMASTITDCSDLHFESFLDVSDDVSSEQYQAVAREMRTGRLAGLVFSCHPFMIARTSLINAPGIPRVAVMALPANGIPCVWPDYEALIAKAIGALGREGRRRLAVVTTPDVSGAWTERIAREADKHGIACGRQWIQSVSPREPRWARNCVHLMFGTAQQVRPDALLVLDDSLTCETAAALAEMGLTDPEELPVISHCNIGLEPRVERPVRFIGYDAGRLLRLCAELVQGCWRGVEPPSRTLLPPQWAE